MERNKLIILASIGILAYIIADTVHEVIGHGGTCLIIGNHIELLTSVYFKSSPGNVLVDMGGPIANLIFGALTFLFLKKTKQSSFSLLLLLPIIAYNLFWFSGTVLHSAFSKTGDWTFAIRELHVGQFGKPILIMAGVLFYAIILRILNSYLTVRFKESQNISLTKAEIYYPLLFASIAAIAAGLIFKPERLHSGFEGLLEMAGSMPILFLKLNDNAVKTNDRYKLNYIFVMIVCVLYVIFCLTLGKGISFVKEKPTANIRCWVKSN